MLQNNPHLKSLIDKLWNKFWSGGISNPLTAIEQITYLIFMKRIDELDTKRKADAEWTGKAFISLFEGDKETLRWSYFKHLKAEEMLTHIQQHVFPFLKALSGENSHFTKHMKNAVFIIPSASLLVESIGIIEELFKEIEKDALEQGHTFQDIQGDVYEMLLSEIATAGKNGQFRTPRHIIKLLAELVDPKLGNKVGDPACGTGGFLLGAYQYIVSSLDKEGKYALTDEDGFVQSSTSALLTQEVKQGLDSSFHGYDIDVTMVRLGLMNLMMHGIDDPQIDYMDTLSKKFNHAELNTYDVILANPPFTGNLNKGESARKIIIEDSQLKAVITLPSGVFKPYAGVATAILIFTKAGETDDVWFYEMAHDGYSLDDKRAKVEQSDLHDIIDKYKGRDVSAENDRKAKHFFVPKKEIVDNDYDLSFNSYKVEVYEEIEYDEPAVILARLGELEDGISISLKNIMGLYESHNLRQSRRLVLGSRSKRSFLYHLKVMLANIALADLCDCLLSLDVEYNS